MNLQQLRYVIAVAETGSMNAAARELFVSQSSLSTAVRQLEQEMGIRVFNRSSRGISPTAEGVEFLGYARQVVEQADLLERRYGPDGAAPAPRLAVSTQHYAFAVRAFIDLVAEQGGTGDFSIKETRTADIIDDVASFRSDLGILYLSNYNGRIVRARLDEAGLAFAPLFRARPHVFVREGHPLAARGRVSPPDLAPYPRYTFDQGADGSRYLLEEPAGEAPRHQGQRIAVSDRATMTALLTRYDGYLVSTGVRSDELFRGIVSVPLETDEVMEVGYVTRADRRPSELARAYLDRLARLIRTIEDAEQIAPAPCPRTEEGNGGA